MSYVAQNGVQVTGQGTQPIVFAHGIGCDQDDWRHVAPRFERDYLVIRYDLTGYGRSDKAAYDEEKYQSLQGHATDLLGIVEELALRAPYFVGHSVGAMIGLLAAVREPRVFSKLALICASPHYYDEDDYTGGAPRAQIEAVVRQMEADYLGWCQGMVPFAMGNPQRPQLAAQLLSSFQRAEPRIATHFGRVTFFSDYRSALPYCVTPTLVVQTPKDAFVPETVAHYLANAVRDGELAFLQTEGHFPQHAGPDELSAVLHRWAAT